MKTLHQNTCSGLSGTNEITYEIGLENDQSLWLKLVKSSGGGFVSKQWVAMAAIMETLKGADTPFTSYVFHTHFSGKSINSPSFLMAVLKQEGLVEPDPIKRQAFNVDDLDTVLAAFQSRVSEEASSPKKKKAAPRKPKPK